MGLPLVRLVPAPRRRIGRPGAGSVPLVADRRRTGRRTLGVVLRHAFRHPLRGARTKQEQGQHQGGGEWVTDGHEGNLALASGSGNEGYVNHSS